MVFKMKLWAVTTALIALTACGGSSSADLPTAVELGEKTGLLRPRAVSGKMCPELSETGIEVYRNGDLVTIKAPKQSGIAEHNPDPLAWNEAHCRMSFTVHGDSPFLRRLAGGSISGRFAERSKADALTMFAGIVRQEGQWTNEEGKTTSQSGSTQSSDNDGVTNFANEFTKDMGATGSLAITVEINPEHPGYPVAYSWDGLVRFAITPMRSMPF